MLFQSDFQHQLGLRQFVWIIQHPLGESLGPHQFQLLQTQVHATDSRIHVLEMKDSLYFLLHILNLSDEAVINCFAQLGYVACPLRPLPAVLDHPVHIETELDRSARTISRLVETIDHRIRAIEDSPLAPQCVDLLSSLRERRRTASQVHKALASANTEFSLGIVAQPRI